MIAQTVQIITERTTDVDMFWTMAACCGLVLVVSIVVIALYYIGKNDSR